jgi:hypothetical protein
LFQGNKKPLLIEMRRGKSCALFSSFPVPTAAWAGIGTWSLKIALQPVAVVSSGQSLNHSE